MVPMRQAAIGIVAVAAMIGTPVLAADMPVKAPPPPPPPVYSWTGFYVGLNGGVGWNRQTITFAPNDPAAVLLGCNPACPPPASFDSHGGLGGIQVGYNWRLNQSALVGVEADWDAASIRGSGMSTFPSPPPPGTSSFLPSQDITSFGTVRGRLGWLATDKLLLYATGGLAFGRVVENIPLNVNSGLGGVGVFPFGFSCVFPGTGCFFGSGSRVETGWTAGTGLEYAVGGNLSLKVEYLYVGLGSEAIRVGANTATLNPVFTPSSFTASIGRTDFQVVRVGLNFRFGGPTPAKY